VEGRLCLNLLPLGDLDGQRRGRHFADRSGRWQVDGDLGRLLISATKEQLAQFEEVPTDFVISVRCTNMA
jgi:hypothetical protein